MDQTGGHQLQETHNTRYAKCHVSSIPVILVKLNTQNTFVFSLSDLSVVLLNLFLILPTICEEEVIFGEVVPGDVYLKESIKSNVRTDSDDSLNVGLLWGVFRKYPFSEEIFFEASILNWIKLKKMWARRFKTPSQVHYKVSLWNECSLITNTFDTWEYVTVND